jgi:hypothetical protein
MPEDRGAGGEEQGPLGERLDQDVEDLSGDQIFRGDPDGGVEGHADS